MFAKKVYKLNREGWAVFTDVFDGLHVGTVRKFDEGYQVEDMKWFYDNTPDGMAKAVDDWKFYSFAREIKKI